MRFSLITKAVSQAGALMCRCARTMRARAVHTCQHAFRAATAIVARVVICGACPVVPAMARIVATAGVGGGCLHFGLSYYSVLYGCPNAIKSVRNQWNDAELLTDFDVVCNILFSEKRLVIIGVFVKLIERLASEPSLGEFIRFTNARESIMILGVYVEQRKAESVSN